MSIISTSNHPKALWPGVEAWFGLKYDEHPLEVTGLFEVKNSDKAYEEMVQSTSFGLAPVKTQGGGISYDSHTQGYTTRATHVVYGLGYIVTEEEIEDDKYSEVSMSRSGMLAYSMRQTKETVGANIYNRAFNSSYTYGDTKELLATDHVATVGAAWSNELNPAAALSEAALEDLHVQIMNATNDRGLKIALMPRKLIVPTALLHEATRILKSVGQADTANNAINVLKSLNVFPDGIVVNHYLTDTNNYFVRTNAPSGMTMYKRRALAFTKDNDFGTGNALAKATERYSFTVGDPRALFGSAPA